jgi:hypothetical protein
MLISSRSVNKHGHRRFLFLIGWFFKIFSSETAWPKNQPIWNKNCLWRPCLLTNRDKISNLYRGPSIDASYQISVHLGKRLHLSQMNWNLVGSIYGRSSLKIAHFSPEPLTNMATTDNSCFWLVDFFKSSPLKPLSYWSYGSWIYRYLCNQCPSPLMLWVRIPFKAWCTRYNIMWSSLLVTCRSMVFSGNSSFLQQ